MLIQIVQPGSMRGNIQMRDRTVYDAYVWRLDSSGNASAPTSDEVPVECSGKRRRVKAAEGEEEDKRSRCS